MGSTKIEQAQPDWEAHSRLLKQQQDYNRVGVVNPFGRQYWTGSEQEGYTQHHEIDPRMQRILDQQYEAAETPTTPAYTMDPRNQAIYDQLLEQKMAGVGAQAPAPLPQPPVAEQPPVEAPPVTAPPIVQPMPVAPAPPVRRPPPINSPGIPPFDYKDFK